MVGEEPEKEEDLEALILPSTLDGVKLVDAPILFFVLSHKAFTKELEELYRVATEGVEKAESGSGYRKVVDDLGRRFEFLKLVYKYHCAAEDEIISPELDTKIKNVVSTYGLEHKRINDDFNSMFHGLDLLRKESEDFTNLFQELIFSIGSIKSIICEHMLKEEKLVFPLVIKHFPFEEQAKLVWQYMCSMPIGLLEDFLPWMASSLPPSERLDLLVCIKTVVPKEEILQEVVISWLDDKKQSPVGACNLCGNGAELYGGQASNVDILKLYPDIFHLGDEEPSNKVYSSRQNPIDGIHIWNSAITRDIRKVLDKLYQIRCSNTTSNLSSTVVQLQFFSDVLIFYSNALDRIFYPMLSEHSPNALPLSRLVDKSQIERLQSLLCVKLHGGAQLSNLLEGLCKEVELLLKGISKNLIFLEQEVCSSIRKNCSYKIQLWLLYAGLQTMPLGLLKCCVLWFCATLSDDQFKIMLNGMTEKCPLVNKHFSSLLHEWAHTGYLGKIPMETFIKDLQESFTRGIYFTSEEIREDTGFSNLKLEMQALNKFNTIELERNSAIDHNKRVCNPSSSLSNINEKPEYGGTILHRFFPQMWRNILSVLKHPAELSAEQKVCTLESRPMDHFVFFHKALIRDLNYIVSLSANVAKSFQFDPDIQSHFELLKFLYDIHSDSEDGVVFPALESKGKLKNITQSYIIDHCLESEQFTKVSAILKDLSAQHNDPDTLGQRSIKYRQLCLKLHEAFLSMQKIISEHIHREEIILWPLFRKYFSIEEQEKIVGCMLGGTRAETLQEMIPWLMSSLIQDEQHVLISLWLKATKNTNFDEWLGEWWEGMSSYYDAKDEEGSCCPSSFAVDPLQVASMYLGDQSGKIKGNLNVEGIKHSEKEFADHDFEHSWSLSLHSQDAKGGQNGDKYQGLEGKEVVDCTGEADIARQDIKVCHEDHPLAFKQKELETAIRRVSRDSTLDSQKKSHVIQSLIMSRWIVTQQNSNMKSAAGNDKENLGQYPSYQDSDLSIFGCKHYKRNCKLLAACCSKLFTCIRCHDDLTDHSVDRKDITKMMCMKCLVIQPIGPKCSNLPCNSFSMAKYYCRICKLFENERQIYHCPYCNLCRVGKGLGIDYFHCMNCNACMSRSLSVHICREKCFMDNCPICHEYIFTSSSPVKALPCGHLMHSECFQEYTYTHYTCPICSKSLGDMQVYFKMIDALLAEEKVPEEYSGQTQIILCNDCESRGTSSFHWLYHKCPHCGSYNTRLL